MLYGILVTLYTFVCMLLVLVIMVQKSKGSVGLGGLGGGTQMLFGGSGGQDIFQKATWILGTIFMVGSFTLAIMKTKQQVTFRYVRDVPASVALPPASPTTPEKTPSS